MKDYLERKKNCFNLPKWEYYVHSKDFNKIAEFIYKEYELFQSYYKNLNQNVIEKFLGKPHKYSKIIEKLIYSKNT